MCEPPYTLYGMSLSYRFYTSSADSTAPAFCGTVAINFDNYSEYYERFAVEEAPKKPKRKYRFDKLNPALSVKSLMPVVVGDIRPQHCHRPTAGIRQ
jgi:hypothetical protein